MGTTIPIFFPMPRMQSHGNRSGTKRWLFRWLARRRGGKNTDESKWAREDSNLQPDRYERSALTVELRAHDSDTRATQYTACLDAATAPAFRMSFCAEDGDTRIPPQVHARARNGRLHAE